MAVWLAPEDPSPHPLQKASSIVNPGTRPKQPFAQVSGFRKS